MQNSFDRLMAAASFLRPSEARNQSSLARFLGESPQTLTNWKAAGSVPKQKLISVAGMIGCDPVWLDSGRGQMVSGASQQIAHQGVIQNDVEVSAGYPVDTRVPVYTWAELKEINNMLQHEQEAREYITTPVMAAPQGSFAIKIDQPQFKSVPPGSFVVFSPGNTWHDGAIAIVRKSGNLVLRRLRSDGDMKLLVAHDDAPWQTEVFDPTADEVFAIKEVTILIDRR